MNRMGIEQKIGALKIHLSSNASDIGDWKIAKCTEASLLGEPMPYDLNDLTTKRRAVRKEINELEEQLANLVEENTAFKPWTEENEREAHPENFND